MIREIIPACRRSFEVVERVHCWEERASRPRKSKNSLGVAWFVAGIINLY